MAGSTSLHPCNTGLSLGLGSFIDAAAVNTNKDKQSTAPIVPLKFDQVLPSLSLGPSDQGSSSYSNNNKNNTTSDRDEEEEEEEASPRKKLRLTKDQSAILEHFFKEHITLNPNQKQALAKQLNLRRRQVEVWFQNRRARTKLKQTEMDCEVLKECCERLTEENKRLQKELLELRSLKLGQVQVGPASVCPSCDGGATSRGSGAHRRYPNEKAAVFVTGMNGTKPPLFLPAHSSAAC